MRILFIGDVVGRPGRKMLERWLPELKERHRPDFTVVNGENSSGGRGINREIFRFFLDLGVDAVTLGNHAWDNKEIFEFIDEEPRLLRPANFPAGTPGRGYTYIHNGKAELGIINLMGRTFLPPLDCPFRTADQILEEMGKRTKLILVDFHAEATAEKQAMGWHLDGRVSLLVGTHTHVQTADERLLPKGTAYITDVGMTGPSEGILGMDREGVLNRFLTQLPVRFEVSKGPAQLGAIVADVDEDSGKARQIRRIRIDDRNQEI